MRMWPALVCALCGTLGRRTGLSAFHPTVIGRSVRRAVPLTRQDEESSSFNKWLAQDHAKRIAIHGAKSSATVAVDADEHAVLKKRVRAMYARATNDIRHGKVSQGITLLEEACRLCPLDAHSWLALARAYREMGDTEAARARLETGLGHCPASFHLAHAAGVACAQLGDDDMARAYFERVLALDPDNAHARHSLAQLETSLGDHASARRLLESSGTVESAAIIVARWELELEVNGGDDAVASRAVAEMQAAARRFEALGDSVSAARLERAIAKTTDDGGIAEGSLARAINLDGGSVKSKVALARFLLFEKARYLDENERSLRSSDESDVARARALLRPIVFQRTSSGNQLRFRRRRAATEDAKCCFELLAKVESEYYDDDIAARAILAEARKIWPRSPSIWHAAGANLRRLGKLDAAARALETAAELVDPTLELSSSIFTTAALVAADRGQRLQAECMFERAHAAAPANGAAYAARGNCAIKMWRDPGAARMAFKRGLRALGAAPNAKDASLRWAATLWHAWAAVEAKCGEPEAARALLSWGLRAAELEQRFARRRCRAKDDAVLLLHSLGTLELAFGRFSVAECAFLDGAKRLGFAEKAASPFLLGAARARLGAHGDLDGPCRAAEEMRQDPSDVVGLVLSATTAGDGGALVELAARVADAARGDERVSARELFGAAVLVDPNQARPWRLWAVAEAKRGGQGSLDADRLFCAGLSVAAPDAALVAAFAALRSNDAPAKRAVLAEGAVRLAGVDDLASLVARAHNVDRHRRGVASLLAKLARLDLASGERANALRLAHAAVAAHDKSAEALLALGACRERAGKLDDADRAYTQAVALDDTDGRSHIALTALRFSRRDVEGARAAITHGLRVVPNDARVWHAAAALEARLGDLDGLARLHSRAKAAGHFFWRNAAPDDHGAEEDQSSPAAASSNDQVQNKQNCV